MNWIGALEIDDMVWIVVLECVEGLILFGISATLVIHDGFPAMKGMRRERLRQSFWRWRRILRKVVNDGSSCV